MIGYFCKATRGTDFTLSEQARRNFKLALMTMGWMVTALSTLFGAPFWFDLLQKATNLRGVKGTAS